MSAIDQIRQMFFIECGEQIEQLLDGLEDLSSQSSDGLPDIEVINTIFRAIHSIKGGAASFNLTHLTRFAHAFENTLDKIRSQPEKLAEIGLPPLYAAADYLSKIVDKAATGDEVDAAELASQINSISNALGCDPESTDATAEVGLNSQDVETDPLLGFKPMMIGAQEDLDADQDDLVTIEFSPTFDLFENGHEPLLLFNELAELGDLTVEVAFNGIDESQKTLDVKWTLKLATSTEERDRITDVFDFCAPFAEISYSWDVVPDNTVAEGAQPIVNHEAESTVKTDHTPATSERKPDSGKPLQSTVRVNLASVDSLMNLMGEMLTAQSALFEAANASGANSSQAMSAALNQISSLTAEIQDELMEIRAQSIKPLFQRMARTVRESATIAGKNVKFVMEGEDTELDRSFTERLVDPLTHIFRNAVDHGIEPEDERIAAGKPAEGTITVSASHRSGRVLVEIRDDGRGIDREKVLQSARKKGLIPEGVSLSDEQVYNILFMPGFSTAQAVTDLSGRGVGMDVVNSEILRLGGRVNIRSELGAGTTVSISFPLTLAVMDGMLVSCAGQRFVVPIAAIIETISAKSTEEHRIGGGLNMIKVRDHLVPAVGLGEIFGIDQDPDKAGRVYILIENDRGEKLAIAVEEIHDHRQVVVKSLEKNYGNVPHIFAATILGDGTVSLIVDVSKLSAGSAQPMPVTLSNQVA